MYRMIERLGGSSGVSMLNGFHGKVEVNSEVRSSVVKETLFGREVRGSFLGWDGRRRRRCR